MLVSQSFSIQFLCQSLRVIRWSTAPLIRTLSFDYSLFCIYRQSKMSAAGDTPPNFYSSEYVGWKVDIFTGVFLPLQVAAVGLRFYTRRLTRSSWGIDGGITLVALILQIILAGLSLGSCSFLESYNSHQTHLKSAAVKQAGVGFHLGYLEQTQPEVLLVWGKYLLAISLLYFFLVNIPKLAILALYRRLFPQRSMHIIIWILVGILCSTSMATIIAALAACTPFEANYDPALPGAVCINKEALYVWSSIPNILTDVVILCLPIPTLLKLKVTTRVKWALVFTFLVGSW